MDVGVFIPIGNNGWLISENAPQYMPSFELNKAIVQKAEGYGFDFALSMIKLRGFGGKTEFWEHNLESFTLMAGLAAVTSKIQLFATAATLTLPPAIVARMASTIDSISGGRFGVNLVTGWQKPEYTQMGMWPGDEFFGTRYQYLGEYAQVLRDLWATGRSDFKGEHFQMEDCRVSPTPQADMKIICAGSSDAGMAFSAQYADYNFCFGKGVNTPTAFAPAAERLQAACANTGRHVTSCVLFMVIADETDEAARAKWEHYKAGADEEAIAWLGEQGAADKGADSNIRQMADPTSAVNINMGTLVGSYANVARMLDEIATVPGMQGVMLTFDDFLEGVEAFGQKIQPLMQSRRHITELKESA
ncbi:MULTISPECIES: pyrimidine utilization protein A [Stutzerimonas stutzeri subgroup]|uniref:Pyrimidine utilization protein A n=1 Tax=Stutzerimonas chloritidismutans TaxID=203192 RepID=A0ACC5VIA4_STUCH|nr:MULTISPECIES: pyrimidine utilization protein A [Stutzerimonas stutzeri subgroup]MBX7271690.1 pyrimidine utilization protein A [Stutzerimonas chloritidismutans]MCQ2045414.1 pyrimidine utilization protein A [Stutzerimonas kunmingensis]PKR27330.1 pyrimidine utilization protein A [Stutzerimonas stutzeri]QQC10975.1 pyrimidine utilization protein A [Stutzerimonas stutzeri]VEI31223.1 luciferase family protein [Stutzerimonas stutzeri]